MKIKVYNLEGKEVREEELDPKIFEIKINSELIQQSVDTQLSNSRQVLAHTKGRSEKRGGGKKPWKQKGTGRARHGSRRSPLWTGGGVTFGPTKERNFSKSINKKAKKKALLMVLSNKAINERIILVEDLSIPKAKTKGLKEILDKLPLKSRPTLIALDRKNENVIRSAKNLPKILTLSINSLNIVDLLKYEYLLMPVKAINKIVTSNQ